MTDYSTAFTLSVITGAAIGVVMLAVIPLAERWYEDARVAPVLVTLALTSFIAGFRNTGLARYERALDFRPFFMIALARKLASFGIGAIGALLWHDYRALLAGILLGGIVEISLAYRLTRFRPTFTLARTRSLLGFSAWWLASQATSMFGSRAKDLLVGQHLGATTLGKYSVALDLATMPTAEIVGPVMRAVYPGYMQMRDDAGRLFSAFTRVWGVVALLSIPSAVGIACIAETLTEVVLGPKWSEAAPLMAVLAFIGTVQALGSCYWPLLLARMGPKTVFRLAALGTFLSLPAFSVALWYWGMIAAILAWIACSMLMLFIGARVLLTNLNGSMAPLLRALVRPSIGAIAMAAVLYGLDASVPVGGHWLSGVAHLLTAVFVGALVYIVTVVILWLMAGRPKGPESEFLFVAAARLGRR